MLVNSGWILGCHCRSFQDTIRPKDAKNLSACLFVNCVDSDYAINPENPVSILLTHLRKPNLSVADHHSLPILEKGMRRLRLDSGFEPRAKNECGVVREIALVFQLDCPALCFQHNRIADGFRKPFHLFLQNCFFNLLKKKFVGRRHRVHLRPSRKGHQREDQADGRAHKIKAKINRVPGAMHAQTRVKVRRDQNPDPKQGTLWPEPQRPQTKESDKQSKKLPFSCSKMRSVDVWERLSPPSEFLSDGSGYLRRLTQFPQAGYLHLTEGQRTDPCPQQPNPSATS